MDSHRRRPLSHFRGTDQRRRLAALIAIVLAMGSALPLEAAPRAGDPAPSFVGRTLDGRDFDLASWRGHVVIVNIWATWCPPCRAEMPALDAFYRQRHATGLEMIGLSADRPRDLGDVRRVMAAFSYPAAMLAGARTNTLGVPRTLPITFIIDARGSVLAVLAPGKTPLTTERLSQAVPP